MNKEKLTHLIFDLGGVIINLDVSRTFEQLADLTGLSVDKVIGLHSSEESFKQHEKGMISDDNFRQSIRSWCDKVLSDQEIDNAWNAMILDLPIERLQLLEKLRPRYSIFLLSNTNNIHLRKVQERLKEIGINSLDSYFDRQYYSHHVNSRKPDEAIYKKVLDENNLNPSKTLFFDDSIPNLDGAGKLGIHTFHVPNPEVVKDFFNE